MATDPLAYVDMLLGYVKQSKTEAERKWSEAQVATFLLRLKKAGKDLSFADKLFGGAGKAEQYAKDHPTTWEFMGKPGNPMNPR